MEDDEKEPAEETAAPPKRGKKWLFMGIPALLVPLVAGGGYFWWSSSSADVAEAAEAAEVVEIVSDGPVMPGGIVTLNPFTVNLIDVDSNRFLRVTIELAVPTSEEAAEVTADIVRVTRARSAILEVLTQQRSSEVATPEGKALVKTEIAAVAEEAIAPVEVMDVLFTDFVIQF